MALEDQITSLAGLDSSINALQSENEMGKRQEQVMKSIISVDQVLDVLETVEKERHGNKEAAKRPAYEEIAEKLVTKAYNSLEATIRTAAAYNAQITRQEPTTETILKEVDVLKTLESNFILSVEHAFQFISGQSESEFSRKELLTFLEYEIRMLDQVDQKSSPYPSEKINGATATLKNVQVYYEKKNDLAHKPQVKGKMGEALEIKGEQMSRDETRMKRFKNPDDRKEEEKW